MVVQDPLTGLITRVENARRSSLRGLAPPGWTTASAQLRAARRMEPGVAAARSPLEGGATTWNDPERASAVARFEALERWATLVAAPAEQLRRASWAELARTEACVGPDDLPRCS